VGAVVQGTQSVTSGSAVKLGTLGKNGALIFTDNVIFVGGANVTASGATKGISIPTMTATSTPVLIPGGTPTESETVPSGASVNPDLYAIAASTTANVSFLVVS